MDDLRRAEEVVPCSGREVRGDCVLARVQGGRDEDVASDEELFADVVCLGVVGGGEEERAGDRGAGGVGGVGEGVEVGEEFVAHGEDGLRDFGDGGPEVELLGSVGVVAGEGIECSDLQGSGAGGSKSVIDNFMV